MTETVSRGEIYHICRAEAVGHEQHGDRPAVIVSNNVGNRHSPVVEIVYLTTQVKKRLPTHVQICSSPRASTAMCEQIVTVDKIRLTRLLGRVTDEELRRIDGALAVSLGIGGLCGIPPLPEEEGTGCSGKLPGEAADDMLQRRRR